MTKKKDIKNEQLLVKLKKLKSQVSVQVKKTNKINDKKSELLNKMGTASGFNQKDNYLQKLIKGKSSAHEVSRDLKDHYDRKYNSSGRHVRTMTYEQFLKEQEAKKATLIHKKQTSDKFVNLAGVIKKP